MFSFLIKLVSVGQLLQLDLRVSAGNHALSVTKHQMLDGASNNYSIIFLLLVLK